MCSESTALNESSDVEKIPDHTACLRIANLKSAYTCRRHPACDLDLDRMTLIYELELDVYVGLIGRIPKMKFLGQGFQKLEHYRQTDRQTDRQMRPNTLPRRILG